jgi:hypothetical protein
LQTAHPGDESMYKIAAHPAILIFALAFSFGISPASSQQTPATLNKPNTGNIAGPISLMSNFEFWLTIGVMIFGSLFFVLEFILLRSIVKNKTEEIIKVLIVTLIIISTLVLITSGFSNDQIAPALGLFGTIAGYLLGKAETSTKKDTSDDQEN